MKNKVLRNREQIFKLRKTKFQTIKKLEQKDLFGFKYIRSLSYIDWVQASLSRQRAKREHGSSSTLSSFSKLIIPLPFIYVQHGAVLKTVHEYFESHHRFSIHHSPDVTPLFFTPSHIRSIIT